MVGSHYGRSIVWTTMEGARMVAQKPIFNLNYKEYNTKTRINTILYESLEQYNLSLIFYLNFSFYLLKMENWFEKQKSFIYNNFEVLIFNKFLIFFD